MDCILFHWCVIHHAVIYHPAFYLEFYVYIYIYAFYILQCVACWNFMYSYVLCQKWRIKHVQCNQSIIWRWWRVGVWHIWWGMTEDVANEGACVQGAYIKELFLVLVGIDSKNNSPYRWKQASSISHILTDALPYMPYTRTHPQNISIVIFIMNAKHTKLNWYT